MNLKLTLKDCFMKNAITLLPCVESMFVSMVTGNMVRGLDEDESSFLDEVSRQQCLVEKQRRDEEKQELLEYRISFLSCVCSYKKHFNLPGLLCDNFPKYIICYPPF